ncbi:hypothetical protein JTE90_011038 [Oedothorax gibbosus]|uniref:Uncharacterized protein n=1 Tax=Oedothorax gibbosus TaxID=931172 RepID=A0AAV6VEK5_9ARAC|nr:hypothetical protein JTE90_011038 [Oedothorax gibbosus]
MPKASIAELPPRNGLRNQEILGRGSYKSRNGFCGAQLEVWKPYHCMEMLFGLFDLVSTPVVETRYGLGREVRGVG